MGEDGERASSIEANTSNGARIDVVLGQGLLDGCTDALPDVRGRLFLYLTSIAVYIRIEQVIHSNPALAATSRYSSRPGRLCHPSH